MRSVIGGLVPSSHAKFSGVAGAVAAGLLGGVLLTACNPGSQAAVNTDGGSGDMTGQTPDLLTQGSITFTEILPSSGAAAGGTTVTLVGSDFAPGATVSFGGVPATGVTVLSKTQLTAIAPANSVLGPVQVTIRNPDGSNTTRGDLFSYYRVKLQFDQRLDVPVGTHPVALLGTDLNLDGVPELATANEGSDNVSVLYSNFAFQNPTVYPTAVRPAALVAADLNGNGRPDLAVACSNALGNDLSILFDNGLGYLAPVNFAVSMNPTAIVAKDLNGDSKIDLVLSARPTGKAYVMNNASSLMTAMFTAGASYDLGKSPSSLLLADLNGDNYPELVSTNFGTGNVTVLPGGVGGAFGIAKTFATSTQPNALALADLNKDGKPELLTTSLDSKQVSTLRGRGDGTFDAPVSFAVGTMPAAVAVADLDLDGNADVVVANGGNDSVTILFGKGDGTYEPAQSLTIGAQPSGLVVVDLNRDGKPDIATANYSSSNVSILYNRISR